MIFLGNFFLILAKNIAKVFFNLHKQKTSLEA